MCNFTNMIGGLILYVRAPSLDHFVFENKNVKILFRFCRRHYFDLRIIHKHFNSTLISLNLKYIGVNLSTIIFSAINQQKWACFVMQNKPT